MVYVEEERCVGLRESVASGIIAPYRLKGIVKPIRRHNTSTDQSRCRHAAMSLIVGYSGHHALVGSL
eukprot:1382076-Amorphochlora_amoeboformis.AAC.2